MYTYALNNPKAKFLCIEAPPFDGHIAHFNKVGKLVDECGELVFPTFNTEWELVREEVDFMTAMNSGKPIKSCRCKAFHPFSWYLQTDGAYLCLEEINGKWLIE